MLSVDKITEVFCKVDDFCIPFYENLKTRQLTQAPVKRYRKPRMSDSEIITIAILFHLGGFRNMKHFYLNYVCKHLQSEFPNTLSYNRFVERLQSSILPMGIFLKTCCLGKCTGISFIDSTPIRVCHTKREYIHKTFKGIAQKGQCSIGWFFGFKLHIIINDKGEILDFMLTPGNTDDRKPLESKNIISKLYGKLFGDKGYISKSLFENLFIDGIHLVTKIRKNMKNSLMLMADKIALRKRSLIETVNDELKNICQIEHTRHRSFENMITNLFAGLIAYSFLDKKPSINCFQTSENGLIIS